jgi:hypothetical protein
MGVGARLLFSSKAALAAAFHTILCFYLAMDELQVDAAGPVWSNILYIFEPSSLLLIGVISTASVINTTLQNPH